MISYHLPLGESNIVEMDHIWDKSFYKNADALMANGIFDLPFMSLFFLSAKCQTMQYNKEHYYSV